VLETPHVVVGAAIATKIPNPLISIPLAFASHFALEKVPHWNPHLNTEKNRYGKVTKKSTKIVIVDVIISLVLGGFIASRALPDTGHTMSILMASFASVLPDVIEGPYFFLDYETKFIKRWIEFQKSLQIDAPIVPGLLTQLATIIAAFWWLGV
jgi:hypothetical protein